MWRYIDIRNFISLSQYGKLYHDMENYHDNGIMIILHITNGIQNMIFIMLYIA